ncbi:type II toxin-antitoxin system RelE/ParE family toxin [Roseateles sp. So40a]|uniref:type II toxin-antitoxin system RelE/ParE family toxin n=1 Tax=Roseateles sp. So40a TaxID=3400226 RepID=UPI003A83B01D
MSEASADLDGIADYIRKSNPSRARSFIHELLQKINGLSSMAESFRVLPRYAASGLRRRVHKPYQIFYIADVARDVVHVVRVLHTSRDTDPLLLRYE